MLRHLEHKAAITKECKTAINSQNDIPTEKSNRNIPWLGGIHFDLKSIQNRWEFRVELTKQENDL
jgi:hypothetical protein